jgi:ureidoglycolate lyase
MVVIGKEPIDFVVVQFANGVDIEDCQEAELSKEEHGKRSVAIPVIKEKALSKL